MVSCPMVLLSYETYLYTFSIELWLENQLARSIITPPFQPEPRHQTQHRELDFYPPVCDYCRDTFPF